MNIRHDLATRWRLWRGKFDSDIGATHSGKSTADSVEYINRVYSDYLAYAGLRPSDLAGKRVLELGPGDNLGVALRFYAAGASQIVCLDKFFSKRDAHQQREIYAALRERLSASERDRYDQAVFLADGEEPRFDGDKVRYVYGRSAGDAVTLFGRESFDIVLSRAVLWEIFDIDRVLEALDAVLKPGGLMIHKIACLDWMFRQEGYHPLEFLTVPDTLYQWMAGHSGKSNRRTIDYYRGAMSALGYKARFPITRVVGATGPELPPGTTELVSDVHYTADTLALIRD